MHLFINYRKKDTEAAARALQSWLQLKFPQDSFFLDSASIPPGGVWPDHLKTEMDQADVVLALIGKKWLVANPITCIPRIHEADDWVQRELVEALSKKTRLVIPVLVGGASMPDEKQLPPNLKPLNWRQAVRTAWWRRIANDWETRRLIAELKKKNFRFERSRPLLPWILMALLLVAAIMAALFAGRVTITIVISAPSGAPVADGLIPGKSIWSGRATGKPPFVVKVDERQATVGEDGTWSLELDLPDSGAGKRTVTIVATDASGQEAKEIRSVQVDAIPPRIELDRPAGGYQLRDGWAAIRGEVSEAGAVVKAESAGRTFDARSDGKSFSVEVELPAGGTATYELVATDAVGNVGAPVKVELRRGMASTTDIIEPKIGTEVDKFVLRMRPIAAQEFAMGSPEPETGRGKDEQQHRVKITKPYWIGETEVTQGQWQELMGTAPWKGKSDTIEGDDVAVSYVTWNEARQFCDKLTEQERAAGRLPPGCRYDLPTEAEWELACRAGSKTAFCFGDDAFGKRAKLEHYAVFGKAGSGEHAHQVKPREPNAWGLLDMHGNVSEWCIDSAKWNESDHKVETSTDPRSTDPSPIEDPRGISGSQRVFRGGNYGLKAERCRSANRHARDPNTREPYLGFRVVLAADRK